MACEASVPNPLERMLLDASVEATNLPISLLESITDNFSKNKKIGEGGFASVYEGRLHNGTVAVKKLLNTIEMDDKKFIEEISCLMKVKHKNVVRFLGYCADAQGKMLNHEGNMVIAEERQRLLCFEFMQGGGLDKHIKDASPGLKWRTRYQIIRGICEGLHYLHQQKIVHLDLKPANILLDQYMVPKIADFGLSKRFDENQTRAVTLNLYGSHGYMAPEFFDGLITFKSDIYSLGIIIIEILTGRKGYPDIENVLEGWSTRFETSQGDKLLEHVRVCAEIGIECTDFNPEKRPVTQRIIERLDEMERTYGIIKADLCTSSEQPETIYLGTTTLEVPTMDPSKASKKPVGTLFVKVVRARNLRKQHLFGKLKPYVKLMVSDHFEKRQPEASDDELRSNRTTAKHGSLNPGWNEEFTFVLTDPENQALKVDVFDWEQVRKHQNIGMNGIPLKYITPEDTKSFTLNLLYSMDPNDVQNEKYRGQLTLELMYKSFKKI